MFDASGKLTDGIAQMNTKFYGNMKECIEIEVSRPDQGLDAFRGKYVLIDPMGSTSSNEDFVMMDRMPIFIDGTFLQLGGSAFVRNLTIYILFNHLVTCNSYLSKKILVWKRIL